MWKWGQIGFHPTPFLFHSSCIISLKLFYKVLQSFFSLNFNIITHITGLFYLFVKALQLALKVLEVTFCNKWFYALTTFVGDDFMLYIQHVQHWKFFNLLFSMEVCKFVFHFFFELCCHVASVAHWNTWVHFHFKCNCTLEQFFVVMNVWCCIYLDSCCAFVW